MDRLHRLPVELEEFVDLCEEAGVRDVATVTADIDLGNDDDGLFMAAIFAAFAAKESGRRSAPVWRKHEQNAAAGLPHGPIRPFGYEPTRSPYASPKRWSFASWWTDLSPVNRRAPSRRG